MMLAMGGYGWYVWPAYLLVLGGLLGLMLNDLQQARKLKQQIHQQK